MDPVAKSSNLPPKKGLTKVQQVMSKPLVSSDNCPCIAVCQKLGTFKQGACFLGTSETHKCIVAQNLLLAKTAGFSAAK